MQSHTTTNFAALLGGNKTLAAFAGRIANEFGLPPSNSIAIILRHAARKLGVKPHEHHGLVALAAAIQEAIDAQETERKQQRGGGTTSQFMKQLEELKTTLNITEEVDIVTTLTRMCRMLGEPFVENGYVHLVARMHLAVFR